MKSLPDDIDTIVSTLAELLRREERNLYAEIMSKSKVEIEETSYDNWDGGTCGYTLNLRVPIDLYATVSHNLESIEKYLMDRLKDSTRSYRGEFLERLILEPVIMKSSALGEANGADYVGDINSDRIRFWKKGYFRLFLSHISQYKKGASRLQRKLEEFAISAFVAHEDIEPTKEWQGEIERALSSMEALGALLTEGFKESDWTVQKIGFALGKGVPVVAIRNGMDPFGFFGKWQAIQGSGRYAKDIVIKMTSANIIIKVTWDFKFFL